MSQHRSQRNERDGADDWVKVLDRIPFVGSVKRDFLALRRLLYDRHAPRLAVVGAAGSGRTSLANALLGAVAFGPTGAAPNPEPGAWVRIDADGRRIDWLELPSGGDVEALREMAHVAFEETPPDILVGVVEAGSEARDGEGVRDALLALKATLSTAHELTPKILVLLTKVDTLPPTGDAPPYSHDKRSGIELALRALRESCGELGLDDDAYVPVCARPYDGESDSPRYNLDGVGEGILERLPEAGQVEAVRAFEVGKEARRNIARALVNSCSALAVTAGLAPIPFADALVLFPLQAVMVTGVAYLSGRPWDRRAGAEWIASVGTVAGVGLGLRWGARQLVKLIPGAGSLIGASIAGAGTLAIGRSAMAYFIDGPGSLTSRPELRADNPA